MARNGAQRFFGNATLPVWLRAALFAVVYFVSAEAGGCLSLSGGTYVGFWLPAGLYVAVLLLNEWRDWPWLMAGALAGNFAFDSFHGTKPVVILFFYCANTLQATLGAVLTRRFVAERPALATLKEFFGLVGFAGILSTMLGAAIGAATLVHFGLSDSFEQSWKVWWGSTAMAVLVFTPFILTWFSKSVTARMDFDSWKKIAEAVLLFVALFAYVWCIMTYDNGIMSYHKYYVIPMLLWAGLRFGARGATAASLFFSVTMAFFTVHFSGALPPQSEATGDYVFILQGLLAMANLVALIPAIVLGERDRTLVKLRASEESLRATIENTPHVAVQWYDAQGRVLFWNSASETVFGWKSGEALGKTLDQLIQTPKEAAAFTQSLAEVSRTGNAIGPVEYNFRRRDGSAGTCISTVFRIPSASGQSCFVCMDVDLTERKAAEESLRQARERELLSHVEFTQKLFASQEQERHRIAAELHDGLAQHLSIIKNRALLARQIPFPSKDAAAHLESIERIVTEAIAETRNLAHDLRPLHIEQIGLTDSLRELIREISQVTSIRFERRLENVDDIFKREAATNIYRIMQEALNNLVKHSRATQVVIALERDVRSVRLHVTDDGVGFDMDASRQRTGLGLTSMTERVRMLGGNLEIQSAPGKGTQLTIELPFADGEAPNEPT